MAKRKPNRENTGRVRAPGADYDSPWKEALDRFFEAFMAFFFPRIHADIDWSRGYETLDKELQPIVRRAKRGRRYVDKLVKVWLEDGRERWILIHIEVQGRKERDFPKRICVYRHRIFDRYDHEVVSLAILVDDDPAWRPNRYEYSRWGFHTFTEFPVVKLLDRAANYEELEADPNPFAVVVVAQLKALETRRAPGERYTWKVRLVKGLYERGMDPEDVRQLFRFIDWVLVLPEPQQGLFWDEIDAYQQEKVMPFIDIAERMGMVKGLLRGIERCLKMKFGAEGLELMPELRELRDHEIYRKVLKRAETATSPEEVRRVWTRKRRPKAAKSE
jgi:hypothetical protein